jgi:hypothetical protein
MNSQWSAKQIDFYTAMMKYEKNIFYKNFTIIIAFINTILTTFLLIKTLNSELSLIQYTIILIATFFLADFINGLVHLIMDHLDHYDSYAGPFIANFHLHHDKPLYSYSKISYVYFYESGHKIWLAIMLLLIAFFALTNVLHNSWIIAFITFFAIWSCIAEVSHYLCHNSSSRVVLILQKYWLLLPKEHHIKHHRQDNINYAFLNGSTDFLINVIAKKFFNGYQTKTDNHIDFYKHKKRYEIKKSHKTL